MVRSHFYLHDMFGDVLKSQGPMLKLSQSKNSQILMDNELNVQLYTKLNTTFDNFRDKNTFYLSNV